MAFPDNPLWTHFINYFISTSCTHESGFKTMVFPASPGVKEIKTWHGEFVDGVDFRHALDEYTRHYKTVDEAKTGHKETVKLIKELSKRGDQ